MTDAGRTHQKLASRISADFSPDGTFMPRHLRPRCTPGVKQRLDDRNQIRTFGQMLQRPLLERAGAARSRTGPKRQPEGP